MKAFELSDYVVEFSHEGYAMNDIFVGINGNLYPIKCVHNENCSIVIEAETEEEE